MIALPVNRGLCSGCEIAIWNIDPATKQIKGSLANYREFCFVVHVEEIVDGETRVKVGSERMCRHAICVSCINSLTDQKVKTIFERIRESWRLSMVGSATIDDFEHLNSLKVVVWDVDQKLAEKKYYGS